MRRADPRRPAAYVYAPDGAEAVALPGSTEDVGNVSTVERGGEVTVEGAATELVRLVDVLRSGIPLTKELVGMVNLASDRLKLALSNQGIVRSRTPEEGTEMPELARTDGQAPSFLIQQVDTLLAGIDEPEDARIIRDLRDSYVQLESQHSDLGRQYALMEKRRGADNSRYTQAIEQQSVTEKELRRRLQEAESSLVELKREPVSKGAFKEAMKDATEAYRWLGLMAQLQIIDNTSAKPKLVPSESFRRVAATFETVARFAEEREARRFDRIKIRLIGMEEAVGSWKDGSSDSVAIRRLVHILNGVMIELPATRQSLDLAEISNATLRGQLEEMGQQLAATNGELSRLQKLEAELRGDVQRLADESARKVKEHKRELAAARQDVASKMAGEYSALNKKMDELERKHAEELQANKRRRQEEWSAVQALLVKARNRSHSAANLFQFTLDAIEQGNIEHVGVAVLADRIKGWLADPNAPEDLEITEGAEPTAHPAGTFPWGTAADRLDDAHRNAHYLISKIVEYRNQGLSESEREGLVPEPYLGFWNDMDSWLKTFPLQPKEIGEAPAKREKEWTGGRHLGLIPGVSPAALHNAVQQEESGIAANVLRARTTEPQLAPFGMTDNRKIKPAMEPHEQEEI